MRALFLTTLVGLAAVSAAALAQPSGSSSVTNPAATLCLDTIGVNHPPICHSQQGSRIPTPPDICMCMGPYRQVEAPYCAKGETPPADTAAFEQARLKAAQDGSLFGDTYEGKRMCVPLQ